MQGDSKEFIRMHRRPSVRPLYIGPDWATSMSFFFSAQVQYFREIPCLFEFIRNSRNCILKFRICAYAAPQACKAKSQQPSRNPRFALDPMLLPTKQSNGIPLDSLAFQAPCSSLVNTNESNGIPLDFMISLTAKGGHGDFLIHFRESQDFFKKCENSMPGAGLCNLHPLRWRLHMLPR